MVATPVRLEEPCGRLLRVGVSACGRIGVVALQER